MRYCINPNCVERQNSDTANSCQSCQTPLLIHHRYYLTQMLREEPHPYTEIFVVADVQHPERQKVLKTLVSANAKAVQLFRQEQALLQKLKHPGIPRGEAAFSVAVGAATLMALVMEKIDGMTLEQWLQAYGTFDQQQAVNLLGQLACILDFIHQRHYFHRDIKPSNIMWSHRTGQFVLIDFGSARMIEPVARLNRQTATMIGTPGYTAPEQWDGNAVPQSDFFALGMTLIHLLTGQHPDSLPSYADWRRHTPKPIVPRLTNLINTLIAQKPSERPQTAQVLLQHLVQIDPSLPFCTQRSCTQRSTAIRRKDSAKLVSLTARLWRSRRLVGGVTGLMLLGGLSLEALNRWTQFLPQQQEATMPSNYSVASLRPSGLAAPVSTAPVSTAPASTAPASTSAMPEPQTFVEYAESTTIPLGLWQYGGSTAWATLQRRIDPKIRLVIPQFQITSMQSVIPQPSTGKGIAMLTEGRLDFALASRTVSDEEQNRAQQRGFHLKQIPVAYDAIGVVVHADLSVAGLTIDQLVAIYTGKVTNWRELGGPNLIIRPLNGESMGEAPTMLKEHFPPGTDYSPTVELINNPSEALQKISQPATPAERGSIYFASINNLIGQCRVKPLMLGRTPTSLVAPYQRPLVTTQCPNQRNQIDSSVIQSGQYPFTRKLFVVVREDESLSTQAGKTYADLLLTPEGQGLIQRAGFVPLRSFELN